MLPGFEEYTYELNEYEYGTLLPIFLKGFQKKGFGPDHAVTNKQIVKMLKAQGYTLGDARVRKIINYIRRMNLIPGLVASSKGYYKANTAADVDRYISSLLGRENEIKRVRESLERYRQNINQ
jgi:hypothetical protein